MLARSGHLPTRGEWSYEVKWDGFRAIVSTEGALLRVRTDVAGIWHRSFRSSRRCR
jgi:hypothetical protein